MPIDAIAEVFRDGIQFLPQRHALIDVLVHVFLPKSTAGGLVSEQFLVDDLNRSSVQLGQRHQQPTRPDPYLGVVSLIVSASGVPPLQFELASVAIGTHCPLQP